MTTASHLPACGPDCQIVAPPRRCEQERPQAFGELSRRQPSIAHYCTSSAKLLLLACTITLARRARAFIVLLAFARFLLPDSCPAVLAFPCKLLYPRALQAIGARAFVTTVLFGLCCVLLAAAVRAKRLQLATGIRVSASASANGCKAVLCYQRFEDFPKGNTGCDIADCGLGLAWGDVRVGRGMATATTMLALGSLLLSNITYGPATSNNG